MKLSRAKVLIVFYLFYIDATFPESIEITRKMPNNWRKGAIDSFQLPQSVCYGNYCNTSLGSCTKVTKDETENQDRYSCDCSEDNATVTYLNNKWRCLGNQEAREQLGCEVNDLLVDENEDGRLRTLNTDRPRRRTKLSNKQAPCAINISSSWYIGCFGEKIPLRQYTNRTGEIFLLDFHNGAYRIEIKTVQQVTDFFLGRVINIGIRCFEPPIEVGCLLFKLKGSLTCPVERPTGPIFSSTINPTTSSLEIVSPSTAFSGKATSSASIGPTQAITQPSAGRKQKNEGDSSSSSLGIIAGVTSSVILLLLLIAAFFIYRRRKSRNHKSSASGQIDKKTVARNPKTNFAFKLEEKNGYVTNHDNKPIATVKSPSYDVPHQQIMSSEKDSGDLYAGLNIPEGHNIYGLRDSQDKMSQNYDSSSVNQPVYNEPEPVYNVLEEPYAAVSEEPTWYGSAPVDGPVYNTLEEPDQYADSTYKSEPVYTVLEGPDQSSAEEYDSYGVPGFQDPVYNVLEGPDPESSKDGLHSNNSVRQDPGSCNTNIPVYAVVNKKKKMTR